MELSFCDLKNKDVVNICDGRNLGNINDMIIDSTCGRIIGIIVPSSKNFFNIFKSNNSLFIPYNRICKIGKDIILVDIIMQENNYNHQQVECCNYSNSNSNVSNINIQNILKNINKDS